MPELVSVTESPTVVVIDQANAHVITVAAGSGDEGGTTDHAELDNLDYAAAGHTGFAGTGVENTFTESQFLSVVASSTDGLYFRKSTDPTTYAKIEYTPGKSAGVLTVAVVDGAAQTCGIVFNGGVVSVTGGFAAEDAAFLGESTAATQPPGTNDGTLATTEFVTTALTDFLGEANEFTEVQEFGAGFTATEGTVNDTLTAGAFVGDGSGLSDLSGTAVTTGTVAEARIDSAIARDSEVAATYAPIASPTFTGTAQFGTGGTRHPNNGPAYWRNVANSAWRGLVNYDTADNAYFGHATSTCVVTGGNVDVLLGGVAYGGRFRAQGGAGVLEMPQVTSLGTPASNTARIGVLDVSGTAEVYVKDEAGNETQISPHAMDGPASMYDASDWPHVVKESNEFLGLVRYLNVSRTCRAVEMLLKAIRRGDTLAQIRADLQTRPLSDLDLFHQETFAQHNARVPGGSLVRRTWAEVQQEAQARYDADRAADLARHAAWAATPEGERGEEPFVRPAADVRKPKPAWLQARGG